MVEQKFENNITGLTNLVGTLLNSGMIASGSVRIDNVMNSNDLQQTLGTVNRDHINTNLTDNLGSNMHDSLVKVSASALRTEKKFID